MIMDFKHVKAPLSIDNWINVPSFNDHDDTYQISKILIKHIFPDSLLWLAYRGSMLQMYMYNKL
jgi:hypothetical protein